MKKNLLKLLKLLDCKKKQLQVRLGIKPSTWDRIMKYYRYEKRMEKDFKHKLEARIKKLLEGVK